MTRAPVFPLCRGVRPRAAGPVAAVLALLCGLGFAGFAGAQTSPPQAAPPQASPPQASPSLVPAPPALGAPVTGAAPAAPSAPGSAAALPTSGEDGPRLARDAVEAATALVGLVPAPGPDGRRAAVDRAQLRPLAPRVWNLEGLAANRAVESGDVAWLLPWIEASNLALRALLVGPAQGPRPTDGDVERNVELYGSEIARAMAFNLRLSRLITEASEKLLATLTPEQRDDAVRREGQARLRTGFIQQVSGVVGFLAGKTPEADAALLARSLNENPESWIAQATPLERTQISASLARARLIQSSPSVREPLDAVIARLARAR